MEVVDGGPVRAMEDALTSIMFAIFASRGAQAIAGYRVRRPMCKEGWGPLYEGALGRSKR